MKKIVSLAMLAALALAGCRSVQSPYDHLENWLIREDAVCDFTTHSDIIYLQGELYTKASRLPFMADYAHTEVGRNKFAGVARIFAPLVTETNDVENAVQWYLENQHAKKRRFLFIGEGEGGRLLKAYEESHGDKLRDEGLVASFYTDESRKRFVDKNLARKVREAILRSKYRETWGREIPDGMFNQ